MLKRDVKIQELTDKGKYLFVYSDRYNVFIIFHSKEDDKLYKIITDKMLNINYIDEILTPSDLVEYKNIRFYRPFSNNGDYIFVGIVIFDDRSYKFKIDGYKFYYTEKIEYIDGQKFNINILSCLKDITVASYIQKKNRLYIVGVDEEYESAIYGVVNMEKNKFDRIYYLYSDFDEIVLNSINTDVDEERVYVCGWKNVLDNKEEVIYQTPFFEMFILDR